MSAVKVTITLIAVCKPNVSINNSENLKFQFKH